MDESHVFELPKASEKLTYKFILDSLLKERLKAQTKSADDSLPNETLTDGPGDVVSCGTQAEAEATLPPLEIDEDVATAAVSTETLPLDKKYFRIGEVAELLKVEAYVIRYWETEFKSIRPVKSGSGHRVYARKDVELLSRIRHLLYVEKFSIKGAKKRLLNAKREPIPAVVAQESQRHQGALKALVQEIKDLLGFAKSNPGIM